MIASSITLRCDHVGCSETVTGANLKVVVWYAEETRWLLTDTCHYCHLHRKSHEGQQS